jgi:excinuclease UvrABC ATPase subunit
MMEDIIIEGAREHNLKNISLRLPREQFIVVTGPSGSGKSSLAFDTIYAEGHRRYVESLSTYARQFLERVDKPDVDLIEGISPAIAIEQYNPVKHSRSTVGTASEIYDYIRLVFAKAGDIHCPECGEIVRPDTVDISVARLLKEHDKARGFVMFALSPVPPNELADRFSSLLTQGYIRAMVDGEVVKIDPRLAEQINEMGGEKSSSPPNALAAKMKPAKGKKTTSSKSKKPAVAEGASYSFPVPVYIVVDRLSFNKNLEARLGESLETAFREGDEHAFVQVVDGPMHSFSQGLECCGRVFARSAAVSGTPLI